MIRRLNDYFEVEEDRFQLTGAFNAFIDVDSQFFLDPHLLKDFPINELTYSKEKLREHFLSVIKLLKVAKNSESIAWGEAVKRLTFKELRGVSIGLGKTSNDGSGVGPKLAKKLAKRAKELVDLGIEEPEIFELIGLFVEDFGPDRLSDMTISIIKDGLFKYTQRLVDELGIKKVREFKYKSESYRLPLHPDGKKPIILLPEKLLRKIPVAKSFEDIDSIVRFNNELREKYNKIVNESWREVRGMTAQQKAVLYQRKLLAKVENIEKFVEGYKNYVSSPYDFQSDPYGEVAWAKAGVEYSKKYPLSLSLAQRPQINDIEDIVVKMINQFQKNIELNGLNELLFKDGLKGTKPKNERNAQLLFYSVCDSYCEANNIDLNREPKPGIGQIDFKYSKGYDLKFIVEIKLSSHPKLAEKYLNQLPRYMQSEKTERGAFLIIQVTNSREKINELRKTEAEEVKKNPLAPKVYIIDGRIKPSASEFTFYTDDSFDIT